MRKRILGLALFGLILFLSGGIVYTLFTPRLIEVLPAIHASEVPASAPLQITFSRPMQASSVQDRFVTVPPRNGQFTWQGNRLTFTPDMQWPAGETIQVRLRPGARATGLLSLPIRQEQAWTFTIGYPRLVYLYPSDGPADLYRLDPRTGEIHQLADVPGEILDFSIGEDGAAIYFSASQGDGGSAIYRWERASGETSTVLECPQALCRYAQASPRGDFLAYERTAMTGTEADRIPQVWLLPLTAEGSATANSRLAGDPDHQTNHPLWSPQGILSFYDTDLAAFILLDPQGGEAVSFPSQTGLPGSWDPAGEYLVIPEIFANPIHNPAAQNELQPIPSNHLMRYQPGEARLEDLTGADDLDDSSPAFSPRGGLLAFARRYLDIARWTPGRQLWVMRADGSEAHPLTEEPFYNHYDFAWSPDGEELAYVRFNQNLLTEPPEIWLIRSEGTLAQQLVRGGYAPKWIP